EPERLADWWAPFAADITVDLREGGAITFDWHGHDIPRFEFTITRLRVPRLLEHTQDRKSTRLNSSHVKISYAVFCLKKQTASVTPPTRHDQLGGVRRQPSRTRPPIAHWPAGMRSPRRRAPPAATRE